jgi:hypothetical protein
MMLHSLEATPRCAFRTAAIESGGIDVGAVDSGRGQACSEYLSKLTTLDFVLLRT